MPNTKYEPHALGAPEVAPATGVKWQVTTIEPSSDGLPKVTRYTTFAEAAEALRISPQHVRALCESGLIAKGKFEGWTFMSPIVARLQRGHEDAALVKHRAGRPIRVIYPTGEIEVFPSIREAATALNVQPQCLNPRLKSGDAWKRGQNKGVRVEYADEKGVEKQARFTP